MWHAMDASDVSVEYDTFGVAFGGFQFQLRRTSTQEIILTDSFQMDAETDDP